VVASELTISPTVLSEITDSILVLSDGAADRTATAPKVSLPSSMAVMVYTAN